MENIRWLQSIVFVSLFALVLGGCSSLTLSQTMPLETPDQHVGPGLGSIEISAAMQTGDPLSCMIMKTNENKQMSLSLQSGKVFLTGNALTPTGTDATLVYDTDYAYVWENGETDGLKSKLPTREDLTIAINNARGSGFNIPNPNDPNSFSQMEAQGYAISCQSTSIADSVFVPPATIRFTDITSTVQQTIDSLKNVSPSTQPETVL